MIRFLSAGAILRLALPCLMVGLLPDTAGAQAQAHVQVQARVDITLGGQAAGPGSNPPGSSPNANAKADGGVPGANQAAPLAAVATAPNQTAAGTNQPSVSASGNSNLGANGKPMAGPPAPSHVNPPIDFASGEAVSRSEQTTFLAMTRFTQTLLDPFVSGRDAGTTPQSGAVDGDAVANAYAPHWNVWASGIGASLTSNGNAMPGSSGSASSRIFGTAVGVDYLLAPQTMAGFAMAGGGTYFNVGNFSSGRSDLFQAGAFIRHTVGQAYVAAALAYGWQAVANDRPMGAAGPDLPSAGLNANAYSGRVESGYRFAIPSLGIMAYTAGQFTTFNFPVGAGQQIPGANAPALALGSDSATDSRSELGVRTDKSFTIHGGVLNLRGGLAWAHDVTVDRSMPGAFQALPGPGLVSSAPHALDSALTTATAEMKWLNGWLAAATFEGEFSGVTRSYSGKAVVRYAW